MVAFVARKAHDPATWFVSASVLLHFGVLLSAFYAISGTNALVHPVAMAMVTMGATYSATAGPAIRRTTGSLWTASWQTIGVPLAIVGIGIPISIAIEAMDHTAVTQAMLFAPWWTLFLGVTIWQHTRGKKVEHPPGPPVFGAVGSGIFLVTRLGILTLVMALATVVYLST